MKERERKKVGKNENQTNRIEKKENKKKERLRNKERRKKKKTKAVMQGVRERERIFSRAEYSFLSTGLLLLLLFTLLCLLLYFLSYIFEAYIVACEIVGKY